MLMFGSLYFILPKVVGADWPSVSLIRLHFWTSSIGAIILILALWSCGRLHGQLMNDPSVDFLEIAKVTKPYLTLRTGAVFLLVLGHLAFAVNFIKMLMSAFCKCCCDQSACASES
jgi:cytochrome c oxidase cbb3-type subunit 1